MAYFSVVRYRALSKSRLDGPQTMIYQVEKLQSYNVAFFNVTRIPVEAKGGLETICEVGSKSRSKTWLVGWPFFHLTVALSRIPHGELYTANDLECVLYLIHCGIPKS